MELTQEYLKSILHYDKYTGLFTWKIKRSNSTKIGMLSGYKERVTGYTRIVITLNKKRKLYQAHRLAWLYENGAFPKHHIDHINHDRSDNRIFNLREADYTLNGKNQSLHTTNKSGVSGVGFHSRDKVWQSFITIQDKRIHLGYFTDKNEAICARLHANRLYRFHANHGK